MKNPEFKVKISDLLMKQATDTLRFEGKFLEEIPQLTSEGISGEITLQSLNHNALLVTIDALQCTLCERCDRCTKEYHRFVSLSGYTAKYVVDPRVDGEDPEEDVLPIDVKNGVIDLQELIYHAIQLQEPFVKYCPDCENSSLEEEDFSDL